MNQFCVYVNADAASKRTIPYWLIVQSDLIDATQSRVVVPLIAPQLAGPLVARLMPVLMVAGKRLVMDAAQITNVPMQMLGRHEADLSAERLTILAALDMLISGI